MSEMKSFGEHAANMPPVHHSGNDDAKASDTDGTEVSDEAESSDPDDTKYTLVMHGLCKKCGVKKPFEMHLFSVLENMSRGRICVYKADQLGKYSGGTPEQVKVALSNLEDRGLIARGMLNHTNGWKLTSEVRESATWFKKQIDLKRKRRKSPN